MPEHIPSSFTINLKDLCDTLSPTLIKIIIHISKDIKFYLSIILDENLEL